VSDPTPSPLFDAELVAELRGAGGSIDAVLRRLEAAENVMRRTGRTEMARQFGNVVEWARIIRTRCEGAARRISEGE
jgi:hypothetical protein